MGDKIMFNFTLPRWVQWGAVTVFLALPLFASGVSLLANIAYFSQYGQISMLVAALSDIGRFVLPIVIVILSGVAFRKLLWTMYIVVSIFSAWAGINYAADTRMQNIWSKTEHAEVFAGNKTHIARLTRDLSQITETSASAALKGQIETLDSRKTQLEADIDYESDPNKNGPCKSSCQGLKDELKVIMNNLATLQARLGQALSREQLETDIAHARVKRETSAPVEVSGFSQFLGFAFSANTSSIDMGTLLINVFFYLILVEGLSHLVGPATATILYVANNRPEEVEEEIENEFIAEPEIVEIQEEQVEQFEDDDAVKAERKRRKDGRFAKKPGPKPKPKVNAKKLKLSELPRPSGANVVDLTSYKKDD
jgi:hypothetical protein